MQNIQKTSLIQRSLKISSIIASLDFHFAIIHFIPRLNEVKGMERFNNLIGILKTDYYRLCIMDLWYLIDEDKKSCSLVRLLNILEQNYKILYPNFTQQQSTLLIKIIKDSKAALEKQSNTIKKIRGLRDTNIAHFDINTQGEITEQEICNLTTVIKEICNQLTQICSDLIFVQGDIRNLQIGEFIEALQRRK